MDEIWKPVPEFDGRYEVSNLGRIRSWYYRAHHGKPTRLSEPRILTGRGGRGTSPYKQAHLTRPDDVRVVIPLHQIICEAFHGPRPCGMEVAHIDGNGWNNRADNLKWATHRENMLHKARHGTARCGQMITEDDVRSIRKLRQSGKGPTAIARELGIPRGPVVGVVYGNNWKWVK